MKFIKLDIADEDNPTATMIEADSMEALLDAEAATTPAQQYQQPPTKTK